MRLHRALRQHRVHRERTAGKRTRVEKAEHHVGVGDGRLLRAAAVAGRPWVAARALRPHYEKAASIDARDRATARANFGDVDRRHLQHIAGALDEA